MRLARFDIERPVVILDKQAVVERACTSTTVSGVGAIEASIARPKTIELDGDERTGAGRVPRGPAVEVRRVASGCGGTIACYVTLRWNVMSRTSAPTWVDRTTVWWPRGK